MAEPVGQGADVVIAGLRCDEVDDLVAFLQRMRRGLRDLKERTSVPGAFITLPGDLGSVVSSLMNELTDQAHAARANGSAEFSLRLARTEGLRDLMAWSMDRFELLTKLIESGMVTKDWERPFHLVKRFWREILSQFGVPDDLVVIS